LVVPIVKIIDVVKKSENHLWNSSYWMETNYVPETNAYFPTCFHNFTRGFSLLNIIIKIHWFLC